MPETGGAATFVRRAFNDFAGFMTGWVLFLDYLIVTALVGALRAPLPRCGVPDARARAQPVGRDRGVGVIAVVGGVAPRAPAVVLPDRLRRDGARPLSQLAAGRARLLASSSRRTRSRRHVARHRPDLALAPVRAAARDARLQRVSRRSRTSRGGPPAGRRPAALALRRDRDGRGHVRRDRLRGALRVPAARDDGARRRVAARAARRGSSTEHRRAHADCRSATASASSSASSGALILLAAVTTSISGFARLAYSLGEHGQLPRAFGRLHRRTLVSPQAVVARRRDLERARDRAAFIDEGRRPSSRASSRSASCSRSRPRSSR